MASSGTESGSAQPEGEATVKQPQYRSDIGKLANPNTVRCGAALTHVTVLLTPLPAGASEERPGGLGSGGLAMGEVRGHGSEIRHLDGKAITNGGDQWFPQGGLWDWKDIKDIQDVVQHVEAVQ
jgi:hypothetical protein